MVAEENGAAEKLEKPAYLKGGKRKHNEVKSQPTQEQSNEFFH